MQNPTTLDQGLRAQLRDAFRQQAKVCEKWGAPTAAAILTGSAAEIEIPGGLLDPILYDWTDSAPESALSLRVLGAVHRLTLDGKAPALAAVSPSAGGRANPAEAWAQARTVLAAEVPFIRSYLARPPQTNEVGRSAMLLGGFLEIAVQTELPLRLFELGASAGLNLCWDRYRIETPAFSWGPVDSSLTLTCAWDGPPPTRPADAIVTARAGCDRTPVDLRNDEDCRRLESYVWTDQLHRLARLRRAREIAIAEGIAVTGADAAAWLPQQLTTSQPGAATVIYHSVFWQYLPPQTQNTLRATIADAGARATPEAPVAWLAMEMATMRSPMELTLTLWPAGETRTLAVVHPHGGFVRWRGAA